MKACEGSMTNYALITNYMKVKNCFHSHCEFQKNVAKAIGIKHSLVACTFWCSDRYLLVVIS